MRCAKQADNAICIAESCDRRVFAPGHGNIRSLDASHNPIGDHGAACACASACVHNTMEIDV